MNEQEKSFFEFLDMRKTQTLSEALVLEKDDRKDEGNILKAKANIYDIFRAIWGAAKNSTQDIDSFQECFVKKAQDIPAAWEDSLKKARENNDSHKILIEEAKLSAVAEIREKYASLF